MTNVRLTDGREVANDSEEWRAECEARAVLQMPTLQQRRDFLAAVETRRGKPAADKLKADIMRLWNHAQTKTDAAN